MPIYDFDCCGKRVEVIQGMNQKPPECPTCGKAMKMVFTTPAIITVVENCIPQRSKGYKDAYAKDYRRRLAEAQS